ncbi:hypothetical protein ACQKL0_13490 [Peribacillus sp. NPDC097264]|uniref:hypothetical protein n=1 Tax=Peribacillus sp. NPDC097264 TaxID=3390616 RepID=UPI003D039987
MGNGLKEAELTLDISERAQKLFDKTPIHTIMTRTSKTSSVTAGSKISTMVIQRKIESSLEEEANESWSKLPEDQRLKRIGFFRKDIDLEKKDKFVRDYINEHFVDRLKKEMELDQ